MKLISFKGPLFPTDYVIAITVTYIKEFLQIFNQCELILLFLFLLFTPLLSYPKEQKEEKKYVADLTTLNVQAVNVAM